MKGDMQIDMDRAAFGAYLKITACTKCEGTGGFYDTTYDRTGEWCDCGSCGGTGRTFDENQVRKLLGWKRIKAE